VSELIPKSFSLIIVLVILLVLAACVQPLSAQQPDVARGENRATRATAPKTPRMEASHRFWDRTNLWCFAGVGASRGLDYSSTLNMRRRGRQEIFLTNEIVDNHPLFAGIEAAGTAASIGFSYLFHRTGHHRLERLTSIIHIGLASSGAIRNYSLGTARTGGIR
jgi:hypothetical protein